MPLSADLAAAKGRDVSQQVADSILGAIARRGMTLRQVEYRSGIAKSTLDDGLHGRRSFNVDELGRLAFVLDTEAAAFVTGEAGVGVGVD